jgi:hypothetical protein
MFFQGAGNHDFIFIYKYSIGHKIVFINSTFLMSYIRKKERKIVVYFFYDFTIRLFKYNVTDFFFFYCYS